MAKNKISEFSSTAADNTDVSNINIAEGCSPSNVNNAIRSVMAQLKDFQSANPTYYTADSDALAVGAGGTGAITATTARTNLSAAKSGANSDITSLTGLTTALSVAQGGTGATTSNAAPFALKGANSDITSLTGLTTALSVAQGGTGTTSLTANNVILGNGTSAVSTVAPGASGNVLKSNGTTWTSDVSNTLTSGTVQTTTSGTSVTFGSIPSWVKRVTVMLNGVSWTTGSTAPMIQLGTSGGIVTTGYSSSGIQGSNTSRTTTGLLYAGTDSTSATNFYWGSGVLTLSDAATNTWTWTAISSELNAGASAGGTGFGAGGIALGGTLTQIKFFTLGGADTFDAGSVNILYE